MYDMPNERTMLELPFIQQSHATTDPNLLDRLKQMLASSARADIAVGYFFISGSGKCISGTASQRQKHTGSWMLSN